MCVDNCADCIVREYIASSVASKNVFREDHSFIFQSRLFRVSSVQFFPLECVAQVNSSKYTYLAHLSSPAVGSPACAWGSGMQRRKGDVLHLSVTKAPRFAQKSLALLTFISFCLVVPVPAPLLKVMGAADP